MILGLTQTIWVLDAETGSPVELTQEGAAKYWAHPDTQVFMFGAKELFSNVPPVCFDFVVRRDILPDYLVQAILAPKEQCMLAAANVEFDRAALARIGLPTPPEKWIDILVLSYIMGFAGRLNDVLKQTGLGFTKDARGTRCITIFSKQMKPWYHDPKLWDDFVSYCAQDAFVEEQLMAWCLGFLDQPWCLPQVHAILRQELIYRRISQRGIPADPQAIEGAQQIMRDEKEAILEEMKQITGLINPNSRDQLLKWLKDHGVEMTSLTKDAVIAEIEYLMSQERTVEQRQQILKVLKLRQELAKTSTTKFDAMARNRCPWDNRIRGAWQFYGASRTGRIAGRIINFANLARPRLKDPDTVIQFVRAGNRELLYSLFPEQPVLTTLSWCIRASLEAPPGMMWCVADLTSIESVGLAWLAGCNTVLDIFFDGRDTYKTFAEKCLDKPYEEVTKEERTYHKAPVLGAGYMMSGPTLVAYAEGMGVKLKESDADRQVRLFRDEYHEIPHYWDQIHDAAKAAIRNPGQMFNAYAVDEVHDEWIDDRGIKRRVYSYKDWPRTSYWCDKDKNFLYCILPSGRALWYYKPSIKPATIHPRRGEPFTVEAIHYYGNDQKATGTKWKEINVHKGLLAENCTQSLCRDAMWYGLEQAEEDKGLEVVGDIYDEVMTLCHENDTTALDRLIGYLTTRAPWMDDRFYLGADGYIAKRYRKG